MHNRGEYFPAFCYEKPMCGFFILYYNMLSGLKAIFINFDATLFLEMILTSVILTIERIKHIFNPVCFLI